MNTLTINSKAALTLARAIEKARQVKPLVRKTNVYGVYAVLSSDKTKEYKVTCNSQTREITCNCPATKPCYHIAAVAPLHSWIARQKQEAEAAALAGREWAAVEEAAETEAMHDAIREMLELERDRADVFGY